MRQLNEKCFNNMVPNLENRHAEKSLKSPWAQNIIIQIYGGLIHSRLESNLLHSSATVSQNLLRFHGATSHALDLTPLAASWVFCPLISDPGDAARNSESYLEIRESLKFVP